MNEACPRCKSNGRDTRGDNLHRYPDGHGYCFACGYVSFPAGWKEQVVENNGPVRSQAMPVDVTPTIDAKALTWLSKYEITKDEVKRYKMLWSPRQEFLIFPISRTTWDGEDGEVAGWQARVFNEKWKAKYFNVGPFREFIYINNLRDAPGDFVVVVEDMVSAIKVGRHFSCMPLFGSDFPLLKMKKVRDEITVNLVFWLDEDKVEKGMQLANRASQLQFESKLIVTKHDPKEHNDQEIRDIIEATT